MSTDAANLRKLLCGNKLVKVAGAHDGLSAQLAERNGFDAIWASGLGISSVHGVPDASILTMTDLLSASVVMNDACGLPVIADCDSGFGSLHNAVRMTRQYESAGIAGVCIEDKVYPKINSFATGPQLLIPIRDFCAKINAVKSVQTDPDFVLIARVEALIAGLGQAEARRRADAYVEAGADAVLIHSSRSNQSEIAEFASTWDAEVPLVVVPTKYPGVSRAQLEEMGVRVVIYANQALRASIRAMDAALSHISEHGTSHGLETGIASVEDVFELQGMYAMEALEERIYADLDSGRSYERSYAAARSEDR